MKTHTYTALMSWSVVGCVVPYIRRHGKKRDARAKAWPAEVRSYLCLDDPKVPHRSTLTKNVFDTLSPGAEILRVKQKGPINRLVTFTVPAPPPPVPAIVQQAYQELDAYGHLHWCAGNDDWFACFDAIRAGKVVAYHVVVNCESGGFVDTVETGTVPAAEAVETLACFPDYYADLCAEQYADSRKREHRIKVRDLARVKKSWQAHLEQIARQA